MNDMLRHIKSMPNAIYGQLQTLDLQVRELFSHNELFSIKEIVITGCGDSYFAGMAARHFFQKICNINTRAIPSMEFSRYDLLDYKSQFPGNPFVIATSISGKVVRTIEAINVAKEMNLLNLAITCDPNSAFAKSSSKVVTCNMPPLPHIPGILSYRLSMIVLFLMGIHLAEVKGNITLKEADVYRDKLKKTIEKIEKTISKCDIKASEAADQFKDKKYFVFAGDGLNLSSAYFSAAKVVEAAGLVAVPQNTEEWAHFQYFENAFLDTPTFLITSRGRGYSRLVELLEPMKRVGRKIIAVSPVDCTELINSSGYQLIIEADVDELFSPLVFPTGCELFAAYLAEYTNAQYFRDDIKAYQIGNNTIYSNQLLSGAEILRKG